MISSTMVSTAVILVVLGLIARRTRVWRPLKPASLFVPPVLLLIGASAYAYGAIMVGPSLQGHDGLIIGLGAMGGVLVGALLGRLIHLRHDPATGQVAVRLSIAGFVCLAALVVARMAARTYLPGGVAAAGSNTGFTVMSNALMALAVTTVTMRQFVLWRRSRAVSRLAV